MLQRGKKAKRDIETYAHPDKQRVNNPPVGLVTPDTDRDSGKKAYTYDPHLDPQLQWAGKAEHTSFEVPTVSLHVHERIDPRTVIEAVRKRNGSKPQLSLFAVPEENPPIRQAIEFYRHRHNWTNRLIAGDSLLVMNSLLEKEGLGGQVQMVYIDPPYGIRYGSNFQPFVNQREVTDGKGEDLTSEPEQIRAFRDTWELGIHSYLAYLRDRLLLARELLHESGSCFVQIGDENVHRVGVVMDEIFGAENRVATISYATTGGSSANTLPQVADYLLWYAKDWKRAKYRQLYEPLTRAETIEFFSWHAMVELSDGQCRKPKPEECFDPDRHLPKEARIYRRMPLSSRGLSTTGRSDPYEWVGRVFRSPADQQWRVSKEGMDRLAELGRLEALEGQTSLMWKLYEDEVPGRRIHNIWAAPMSPKDKHYVVETATSAIQRCILMTTDPGDLVFDPSCGSGTTALVAEQWGRRWITCDTSRVAVAIARQRLMTANFDYYELAHPDEGVGAGFRYRGVATVSARTLGYDEPPNKTMLYDQPHIDRKKARVTGPFTVEAVPAPTVKPLDEIEEAEVQTADNSVARTGQTLRQSDWRDELLKTGIRAKAGQRISFARLEPLPGTRWLHAEGETRPDASGADRVREPATAYQPQRLVVSFGPDHAPLEQRQVERAWEEARTLIPKPRILVFAAFQFDPEAAKDIDEMKPELTGMQFLKVQMNADLLTEDLKRKRASNESFWLIGQPDVEVLSFEFLVFSEGKHWIAEYGTFKKLSGLDCLEEIHRLDRQDLFFYAILSQGRDVWHYLADTEGWDFHSGQYRGRTSQKIKGGIPAISWNWPRLSGGIGNIANDLKEFGISDLAGCRSVVERLRGNREITGRLEKIAETLNFPINPLTQNYQLKTQNWHGLAVQGFDYYNTKTGNVESGGADKIALWMLDPDYDGRSLFPRQIFFPMAGGKDGWAKLARNLKAEIDTDRIEAYRGTVSLPFEAGEHKRIAVKIVDDRGIESLKVVELD